MSLWYIHSELLADLVCKSGVFMVDFELALAYWEKWEF